jgi:hypothetical protein
MGKARLDYILAETPRALEQSRDGLQRIATIVGALKEFVPVGTALSGRPPDRTRRADFPHRAPTSGQRVAKRLSGQG